jgi:hypothetical protein
VQLAALLAVAIVAVAVIAVAVDVLAFAVLAALLTLAAALLVLLLLAITRVLVLLTALVLLVTHYASPFMAVCTARESCPGRMNSTPGRTLGSDNCAWNNRIGRLFRRRINSLWRLQMDSGDGSPVAWFTSIFIAVAIIIGLTLIVSANLFY